MLEDRIVEKSYISYNLSLDYRMDETKRSNVDRMMWSYPESAYSSDVLDEFI